MERIPVETLHHIFTLACCDGGYTGRSLSLACKAFRNVVRSIRYHSVALVGFRHVECFLRCYHRDRAVGERQGSPYTPTIRHLFLRPDATDVNGVDNAMHGTTTQQTLCEVLRLAGPTLITLLYTGEVRWEDLLVDCQCEFPNLKELTFTRRDSFEGNRHAGRPPYPQLAHQFPALRKLHVVFVRSLENVETVLGKWAEVAPNVSHVRASGLHSGDMPIVAKSRRPYASVRHIVLQPGKRPPPSRCGFARRQYDMMVQSLEWRLAKVPRGATWVLLEGDTWGGALWQSWIEGVNGGAGA